MGVENSHGAYYIQLYSANIFRKTTEGVFSVKLTVLCSIKMYLRAILKHLYCASDCRFDRKYSFHCLVFLNSILTSQVKYASEKCFSHTEVNIKHRTEVIYILF